MEYATLQCILQEICATSAAPGGAAIVVAHDTVIAQSVTGTRRLHSGVPIEMADRFHIGSNSKAWTATICGALVDRQQLSWQTTPLDVFPDLRAGIHPEFAEITLEMLLRHMAAIPPYTESEHLEDLPELNGAPAEQRLAFTKWLLQERQPTHRPGTEMAYSNAGYCVAAAMAETATGSSWEQLIQEIVSAPLGINTGVGWPAAADAAQPWGHRVHGGQAHPHPPDDDYQLPPFIAPAGDINISMPDYGRFLQMNLQALQGQETLLPGTLLRTLHNDGEAGIGLGWGVQSFGELGLFSVHSGSAGTFLCMAAVAHDRDRAVAVAVNGGSETDAAFDQAVIAGFKQIVIKANQ